MDAGYEDQQYERIPRNSKRIRSQHLLTVLLIRARRKRLTERKIGRKTIMPIRLRLEWKQTCRGINGICGVQSLRV